MELIKRCVLIVDDSALNRRILRHIIEADYEVEEAENGKQALDFIVKDNKKYAAILLDLVMPVMDGYTFLHHLKSEGNINLPILVTTGNTEKESEKKAFQMGAWDFVPKPYDADILKYRLQSAIIRSESGALERLKYLSTHDVLTGLYNRTRFFTETENMLQRHRERNYVFVRFDIERFSLINTFFGTKEGDNLLVHMSNVIEELFFDRPCTMYGRIEADEFALCTYYENDGVVKALLEQLSDKIKDYPLEFAINISFGVFFVSDKTLSARQMLDYAKMASKKAKGTYNSSFSYYDDDMGAQAIKEQSIINEMHQALNERQFEVYYQPKYDIRTNMPSGAEALVRWNHPQKGMISPAQFIPVFEKNGFVMQLDYYVWDEACALLALHKKNNVPLFPISVNVSRVHLYTPALVEKLCKITDNRKVDRSLLQLELTESMYTENSALIKETLDKLHEAGFQVMMDDFGSGYSSLNVLKDVDFDILKIDMRFFDESLIQGRSNCIITSVVRMAKWLGLPTIAEGVEKKEQVDFLKNIGCEYVQGYYFSRPLPYQNYTKLLKEIDSKDQEILPLKKNEFALNIQEASQIDKLFSFVNYPIALYEMEGDKIEIYRVNNAFYDLFGYADVDVLLNSPNISISEEHVRNLKSSFRKCVMSHQKIECEYEKKCFDGQYHWIRLSLSYLTQVGNANILLGELLDISDIKPLFSSIKSHIDTHAAREHKENMLIVDDNIEVLEKLSNIFSPYFELKTLQNGQEALVLLEENQNKYSIILLGLCLQDMKIVDFLSKRKEKKLSPHIPIVVISKDTMPVNQAELLELGVSDYIVKPFLNEMVIKRIDNVLQSTNQLHKIKEKYRDMVESSKKDSLTNIFHRRAIEEEVAQYLIRHPKQKCAFLLADIDDFKNINDKYGHIIGDQVITLLAQQLLLFFRKTDMVGRLGGDEFVAFLIDVEDIHSITRKTEKLLESVRQNIFTEHNIYITISVGIALSDEKSTFLSLYQNSDKAMYQAKKKGKNTISLYSESEVK